LIPKDEELIKFIKSKKFVNYSIIAKHYNLKNVTVSDIVKDLEKKNLVEIINAGGNKMIQVKENKLNKKSQVTLYIILGLIVLIAVVAVFYLKDYIIKSDFEKELENIQVIEEFKPVKNYLDSCISKITLDGATILGLQGGYINIPYDDSPVSDRTPFLNKLSVFNNNILQVPYWFYETANGIQKTQIPGKEDMQDELANYVALNLNNCLNNFTAFEGYDFGKFNNPKINIEIENEKILVKVESDFEVSKGDLTTKFDKFLVSLDNPLGNLYDNAKILIEENMQNNFFEERTYDMMVLYDEIPLSNTEFSCETKIWNVNKIKDDFKKIASKNIGAMNVENNIGNKNYFTLSKIDDDINANFLYSENWPFYLEVYPNENGILKEDDVIQRTGALKILSSLFCLKNYHFVYDVKYPVLVTLSKNNYNFQFANLIIIDNNQPKENLLSSNEIPDVFNLCDKKIMKTKVNTLTVDENNEIVPLDKVDVSFKCFSNTCSIGKTKLNDEESLLEEDFPQCINGQIIGEKDGYFKSTLITSTNQESEISLILDKIYDKGLVIKLIDKNNGEIRDLTNTEQVLINFKGLDNENSFIIDYPETKKISLIPGTYKVNIEILKESLDGIEIKGNTIENCVSVPKEGVLGIFFDETKCLSYTFDDFTLDMAITGGVEFEFEVSHDDLIYSNELIIYAMFDKIPKTNDEITSIQESISVNKENKYFKYPEFRK
jgi:hypothetical protein